MKMKKVLALLMAVMMVFAFTAQVSALGAPEMKAGLKGWLLSNVSVSAVDGSQNPNIDWTFTALKRSGVNTLDKAYKDYVKKAVGENADSLYLSDCARYVLAVGAAGLNVKNIGGVDLIKKITSADLTAEFFTAGLAFALIALDSNSFGTDADRGKIIDLLIEAQRDDGGFNTYLEADAEQSWTVDGEIDATGMVLQALAPYKTDTKCASVINDALQFIKTNKLPTAGYESYGSESAESTSQVLFALCSLGIDPLTSDYMSGGNNIIDALSAFIQTDGGGRCYDGTSNVMTSYQMLMAIDAYERYGRDMSGVYDMSSLELLRTKILYSNFGETMPRFAAFICTVIGFFWGIFTF